MQEKKEPPQFGHPKETFQVTIWLSIHSWCIYHSLKISDPSDFSTLTPSLSTALLCLCSDHLLALSKPKLSSTKTKRRASPTTKAELWSVFHILWPFTLRSAWRWSYKKRTGDQWETGFKIIKTRHLCSLSLLFVSASFSSIQSKQTMAFVIFMTQWRSCPTRPMRIFLEK